MNAEALQAAYRFLETHELSAAEQILNSLLQDPDSQAQAHNGLGLCAELKHQASEAENHYRQALQLEPQEPEFNNNLAICLQSQGRLTEALPLFLALLQSRPDSYTHYNVALLSLELQKPWEALAHLDQSLTLNPRFQAAQKHIYSALEMLYLNQETGIRLQKKVSQYPHSGVWHLVLGIYYELHAFFELSLRYYRMAFRCNPLLRDSCKHAMTLLLHKGQYRQALALAVQLHELEQSPYSLAKLVNGLQEPLPSSREEMQKLRQELASLIDHYLQAPAPPQNSLHSQAQNINFYHVYQGQSDRHLQEKLAQFHQSYLPVLSFPPHSTHVRPRLGIISAHFYHHSVMHVFQKTLKVLLSSPDFESWCFLYLSQNDKEDHYTAQIKADSDHCVSLPSDYRQAAQRIAQAELDILIYLDIGMEPLSYTLAQYRLAPCQIVLPGHPVSTGSRNIDFFISGSGLDPEDGQTDFTETLIRLKGLPAYTAPVIPPKATRAELQMPEGILYFCPMTLFKVHPDFDEMVAQLLDRDPSAQVAFLQYRNQLHEQLKARINPLLGSNQQRLHFIPWGTQETFYQRLRSADLILDTFYFGGGNTSYQAFGLGCPIITLNCRWNKGRWTQALYQRMGLSGLVVDTPEAYIERAIQLAHHPDENQHWRQQILERAPLLFEDNSWAEELLAFCRQRIQVQKKTIEPS